jgi:hypothetical protein
MAGRNIKTAAVSGAILRHLRRSCSPEAPLTKPVAQERCMAKSQRLSAAFNKAWAALDPSSKEDAKHGSRILDILETYERNLRPKSI